MINKVLALTIAIIALTAPTSVSYSQNTKTPQIRLAFRINDLNGTTFKFYQQVIPIFKKNKIPVTVGINPFQLKVAKEKGVIKQEQLIWLKNLADSGFVEIAQVGYKHIVNYENDHTKSEFYAQPYIKQLAGITEGRRIIRELVGINPTTFIPPWNSFDKTTTDVLTELNFEAISCVRYGFYSALNTKLIYIPYTSFLQYLENNIKEIDQNRTLDQTEKTIVVVIHHYDFTENKKRPVENDRPNITVEQLDQLLQRVSKRSEQKNMISNEKLPYYNTLNILTIKEFKQFSNEYTNLKFKNSSQPDYLLPLPSIISSHSLSGYYNNLPLYKRLRNLYIEILYYISLICAGISVTLLSKKIPKQFKIKKLIMRGQGIRGLFALIFTLMTVVSVLLLGLHNDSTKIIFTLVTSGSIVISYLIDCYVKKMIIFDIRIF